jgi:hypothetical protein
MFHSHHPPWFDQANDTCWRLQIMKVHVIKFKFYSDTIVLPITMTLLSKARTVFARSNTGIVGSNSTRIMHVCVHLFSVLHMFVAALRRDDPTSKQSCRLCVGLRNWRDGLVGFCEPVAGEMLFRYPYYFNKTNQNRKWEAGRYIRNSSRSLNALQECTARDTH